MSKFIILSKEEIDRAKHTDLATMLQGMGETVRRSGSEYEWLDGGRKVTLRGNLWYHQYDMTGGDAIDFAKRFFGCLSQRREQRTAASFVTGREGEKALCTAPQSC